MPFGSVVGLIGKILIYKDVLILISNGINFDIFKEVYFANCNHKRKQYKHLIN